MVAGMVAETVAGAHEAHPLLSQTGQACAVVGSAERLASYSSEEWEESDVSDTEGDHSDSSDDDDPKSQVDRLIDQVTLVYLDGENSNLSSESESSDDDSECEVSDSESDITDVSPLVSATASPLGLSPVLPRRTVGTSPLALHDNRTLGLDDDDDDDDDQPRYAPHAPRYNGFPDDSTDMSGLLKAVVELEKRKRRRHRTRGEAAHHHHHPNSHRHHNPLTTATTTTTDNSRVSAGGVVEEGEDVTHHCSTNPVSIHPIDASPHHRHLHHHHRPSHHRRKNMSFTNEEVRRIDRENQLLLQKIVTAHNRPSANTRPHHTTHHHHHNHHHHQGSSAGRSSVHRPANATVTRRREEERIRRENMILLRKIQEAKPSREVASFRSPRHRASPSLRPPSGLHPPPAGSCGATARSSHAATPTPRKETAL